MITLETVLAHPLFSGLDRDTIYAFRKYHKQNPDIYLMFKKFAYQAKQSGVKHYGAKAIMERARYHTEIERRGEWKVNNNFSAYFARLLAIEDPSFEEFFEFRRVRGLERIAA